MGSRCRLAHRPRSQLTSADHQIVDENAHFAECARPAPPALPGDILPVGFLPRCVVSWSGSSRPSPTMPVASPVQPHEGWHGSILTVSTTSVSSGKSAGVMPRSNPRDDENRRSLSPDPK